MNELLAGGLILVVVLVGIAAMIYSYRRTTYTPVQFLLDCTAFILLRLLWRTQSPPSLPLPPGQGAVIVANHRSSVDPFYIHLAARRRVRWMVAREFCENRWFGWFLEQTGAIPTRRGGIDNVAIRRAVELLKEGHWVGILPEGRINLSDQFLLPVRPGAALIARRAGVPLLPVFIEGAPYDRTPVSPFFMPARVKLHIGTPVYPDDFETDQQLILAAATEIARAAGLPDFEPQLAGRNWRPSQQEIDEAIAQAKQRRRPEGTPG